MNNWKYTDATNSVVARTHADRSSESCLVSVIADWLSEGNTPEPADPIVIPIPASLSMAQARLALLASGHLDAVIAGISSMPREAQIRWEFAHTVDRADPLTATLAAALGLDSAALDSMFTAGSKL